jgi:sugar O-acyltransferase (sialic acid O-acetyltransferase NeuD family)
MENNLIIWGATGQSIVIEEFITSQGYKVTALFDKNLNIKSPFEKIPLFHTEVDLFNFIDNQKMNFIVAIGGSNGAIRLMVHDLLIKKGLIPITVIHPSAVIASNALIGEGSQILANATICSRVKIGKSIIVNSSASVDHECILEDGVHIGPGAKLAGCIEVGLNSFIGTGAVVLPRIKIGKNSVIGAGSVVTKNIPDNVIAYGNPCRVIKTSSI